MINQVLNNLEKSIDEATKKRISKSVYFNHAEFVNFSNNLKNVVANYQDLKEVLFKNNENALHFSGDILAKTFHDYWTRGGEIESIFIENAQATSFYANFETIW